jgi:MoxR-like ATPase
VPKAGFVEAGPLGEAFGWRWAPDGTVREPDGKPRLVLIDEIDKAPRDFPNDLLWVIDQMNFRVPEIEGENEVACPADRRPVVVITSNEERRLPGPFLRRCVQHRIELDSDAVKRILTARLIGKRPGRDALDAGEERLLRAAVGAWDAIRATRGLSRPYTIDEVWRHIALAARHRAGPQAREGLAVDLEGRDPERLRAVLRTLLPPADLDLVQPVVAAQAASG